jgi:predicted ATP-grasp superfamily ATP-dependent carboligase
MTDVDLEAIPDASAAMTEAQRPILASSSQRAEGIDAVVTQGWGRIAYNIVRSLGRKGVKVALGMDEYSGMAALSRYTGTTFTHPSFVVHPVEFVRSVRESLIRYKPKVYIPSDQEILAIARYRDLFDDVNVEIPISSFETLKTLHKKNELTKLASQIGIPTPETIVPRNQQELMDFAQRYGDPIVVKRLSSSASRGVFYVDRADLESGDASPVHSIPFGDFLVQKYVKGVGYGVSMLFNHGKLRAKFTHKRLREKMTTGGISTLRMSTVNPLLEDYAEQILRHVNFHGVAMAEFKYDEESRQAWLIEVNPRFWGSLALAIQSGVDFPYLLYQLATEGDIAPVLDYRTNVTVKWLLGDTVAKVSQWRHRAASAATGDGRVKVNGYDDFYWNDPLPFIAQLWFSVMKQRKTAKLSSEEMDPVVDLL